MKKVILLGFFLFALNFFTVAQVKILFDATKAETAGNADWIIDADNWDLGYNPNPATNSNGNESDPQQIPTPAQSGISSGTDESYWTGAISSWGVDMAKMGYIVESLPYNGQITYGNSSNPQDLSNYKVFIVCEPNIPFTTAEKTALMNFIQNGGGLFMISDHDNSDRNGNGYDSPHIWDDFIQNNSVQNNPFGFSFDYENFDETTSNIPNLPNDPLLHGSEGNVSQVAFFAGTSLTLNPSENPSVKGVVYRSGYSNTGNTGVMCAHATYGSGKVVAFGDSSPVDDGSGDPNDNLYDGWISDANGNHERLIVNATIWLASSTSGLQSKQMTDDNIKISLQDNGVCFFIESPSSSSGYNLYIYNVLGQDIKTERNLSSNRNYTVNLTIKNIYFYRLMKQNKVIKTGKIL